MQHCDEQSLSLMALGEQVLPAQRDHVTSCSVCAGEVDALRRVVEAVRPDLPPFSQVTPVAPPPAVWARIAEATGVSVAPRGLLDQPQDTSPVSEAPPAESTSPSVVSVAEFESRRARRSATRREPGRSMLLLVAAAALVVGAVAGVTASAALRSPDDTALAAPSVIERTQLSELPEGRGAAGTAEVVQTADGRQVTVDVSRLPARDGFYEVWLIDSSLKKMYPIGVLSGATGTFSLPPGLDLSSYPVLDISIEPLDGDPTHSGVSVLRGTMRV